MHHSMRGGCFISGGIAKFTRLFISCETAIKQTKYMHNQN